MTNWFDQLLVRNVAIAPNQVWNLARRTCCLKASSIGRSIVADLSVVMAMVYRTRCMFDVVLLLPEKIRRAFKELCNSGTKGTE